MHLHVLEAWIQRPNLVASPEKSPSILALGEGLWGANSETG
jgi:hypothetical protein